MYAHNVYHNGVVIYNCVRLTMLQCTCIVCTCIVCTCGVHVHVYTLLCLIYLLWESNAHLYILIPVFACFLTKSGGHFMYLVIHFKDKKSC